MQQGSRFSIGQRIEVAAIGEWLVTRLEDIDETGDRIVIAWPTDRHRRLIALEVGDTVQLAASTPRDALYQAAARVEQATRQGVPLLGLAVIDSWQRSQRRTAVRVPVAIRPRIVARVAGDRRQPLRGGITDLSADGVQVRFQDEVKVGERLELAFSVMGIPEEIHVDALVRRVEQHERGSTHVWEAGCSFERLPQRLGQKLVQFIFAQQRVLVRNQRSA